MLLLNSANLVTKIFVITCHPATSCVRDHDASTVPARHMWEAGSVNWAQFMLQWYIRFPKFAEFNENSVTFRRKRYLNILSNKIFHWSIIYVWRHYFSGKVKYSIVKKLPVNLMRKPFCNLSRKCLLNVFKGYDVVNWSGSATISLFTVSGKEMFLHLSVILFTVGGEVTPLLGRHPHSRQTPPPSETYAVHPFCTSAVS